MFLLTPIFIGVPKTGRLFATRPIIGIKVQWKKNAVDDPNASNFSNFEERIISTSWPNDSEVQFHVSRLETELEETIAPSSIAATSRFQQGEILHTEANLSQIAGNLSAGGDGYSTILFKAAANFSYTDPVTNNVTVFSTGDPVLRVFKTVYRDDADVSINQTAVIGETLLDPIHDHVASKAGFVVNPDETVFDVATSSPAYDRSSQTGSIIATNLTEGEDRDTVIWYESDALLQHSFPVKAVNYSTTWPSNPFEIVLTSLAEGSDGDYDPSQSSSLPGTRTAQPKYIATDASHVEVYVQDDDTLGGYNLNEEHAFVDPSGPNGPRVFALRNDLNDLPGASSDPYVLVKYQDRTQDGNPWAMRVYDVKTHLPLLRLHKLPRLCGFKN